MKKVFLIILAGLFIAGISAPVFARTHTKVAETKYEFIRGEVVSINAAKNTIVVKANDGGKAKTYTVSDKAAAELKVGDNVKVKIESGSHVAESVKVLPFKAKNK